MKAQWRRKNSSDRLREQSCRYAYVLDLTSIVCECFSKEFRKNFEHGYSADLFVKTSLPLPECRFEGRKFRSCFPSRPLTSCDAWKSQRRIVDSTLRSTVGNWGIGQVRHRTKWGGPEERGDRSKEGPERKKGLWGGEGTKWGTGMRWRWEQVSAEN